MRFFFSLSTVKTRPHKTEKADFKIISFKRTGRIRSKRLRFLFVKTKALPFFCFLKSITSVHLVGHARLKKKRTVLQDN